MRESWDDYFMKICDLIATRATCDRLHVGALIVKDRRILATGYNGSPPGMAHCDNAGHLLVDNHCRRTIHAEQNAILQCKVRNAYCRCNDVRYTLSMRHLCQTHYWRWHYPYCSS